MSVHDLDEIATASGQSRLRIVHRTVVDYHGVVRSSFNEVRMTPSTMTGQLALEARVEVTPRVAAYRYIDYFGAHVVAFDTQTPHERMEIIATSLVEVDPYATHRVGSPDWEYVLAPHRRDRNIEWLADRRGTHPAAEVAEFARHQADQLTPRDTALAVCAWVHERLAYIPGSTGVQTTAEEAWAAGSGVCQDFAQVVVGALRSVGIPSRYVSGYLHPYPDAPIGSPVQGQSHAWVEWWVGDWQSFDPTNNAPAGSDHVVVAKGRDYEDVPPMRGVYSGPAGSTMSVTVEVTRMR